MPDTVYVLINEAMPGLIKIGLTGDSVEARLTALSSPTGVPLAFECYFAAEVKDGARIEKTLHLLFAEHRINPRREFFRLDPEKVVLAISIGEFREVTPGVAQVEPEEQEALERVKARRPRLRLDAIGIKPGDVLLFSRDESGRATVLADGKLLFDGETLSPSARWGSAFIAASAPWLASLRTNGNVALFSAKAEVRATAPGMLATQ